jgi:2-keto-4-pentenoate hydratase/2-oxohepta-3-ene-1,7-dioic acid hydratase in catechol pathway
MRLGRFVHKYSGDEFSGIAGDDFVIRIDNLLSMKKMEEISLSELEVLTPVMPKKIVAVGLNYRRHAEELNMKIPDEPVIFLKPESAVLPHLGNIVYPEASSRVDYEAELAIVIKHKAKGVRVDEAGDYILGFTPFNDVTARDLQAKDGQWARAKGFDTFAPFGPYIDTDVGNPDNLKVQAVLNGRIVQDSDTSDMIFPVDRIVSFVSGIMTLYPGDIIATGTPEGIGPMRKGDEIVIRIGEMTELKNFVV